ncbi:MAG: biliverdin-producing heme oxygenase [Saprospiraceae bacterium]
MSKRSIKNDSEDILTLLKTETRTEHHRTEKFAYAEAIRTGKLTMYQYEDLITKNWYIHTYLENAFIEASKDLPNIRAFLKNKSDWLLKDLKKTPPPKKLQPIYYSTKAALLGGLYVVEGSMLGGRYIAQSLNQNKSLQHIRTFYFFTGLGEKTRERWIELMALLTKEIQTKEEKQEAVESARLTFNFFQEVYQEKL